MDGAGLAGPRPLVAGSPPGPARPGSGARGRLRPQHADLGSGWVTNRVTPGKIILGELGDIESGVRQLIRSRPVEATAVELPSGRQLRAPTPDETLRIKGYLIVRRNRVRDYLDVAALSDRYGIQHSGQVLARIDSYYADQRGPDAEGVATQLARQLSDPRPADRRTIGQLGSYKGLDARWATWAAVTGVCRSLAVEMTR